MDQILAQFKNLDIAKRLTFKMFPLSQRESSEGSCFASLYVHKFQEKVILYSIILLHFSHSVNSTVLCATIY
jgi:hypothetical protein